MFFKVDSDSLQESGKHRRDLRFPQLVLANILYITHKADISHPEIPYFVSSEDNTFLPGGTGGIH